MHWLCHNRAEPHPPVIIEYSSKQKKAKWVSDYPLWVIAYPIPTGFPLFFFI
jgi:hypothetical protein